MSLFDESEVAASHQKLAASISGSRNALNVCTRIILDVAETRTGNNTQENTLVTLGWRIVNNCGASTKLLEHGYFIQSGAQMRDLAETGMLISAFNSDISRLDQWLTLEGKKRHQEFGRPKLRKFIDAEKYNLFNMFFDYYSEYGSHPAAVNIALHFDGKQLHRGPHYNPRYYIGAHKNLAMLTWYVSLAAAELWELIAKQSFETRFPHQYKEFRQCAGEWEKDLLPELTA